MISHIINNDFGLSQLIMPNFLCPNDSESLEFLSYYLSNLSLIAFETQW